MNQSTSITNFRRLVRRLFGGRRMGLWPKPINHSPISMIGQSISHYKILEKLGEGRMFENHPRTFRVSGCDFQNPRLPRKNKEGGQAPKCNEGGGVA